MPEKNSIVGRKEYVTYMPAGKNAGRKGYINIRNVCQLTQVCRIGLISTPYPILASLSALAFRPEKKKRNSASKGGINK